MKLTSISQLYELLDEEERLIVDVLRQIVTQALPHGYKEKLSFNVPYFFGNRGICIIWPASIKGGGIREGILLGFWYGSSLQDPEGYLTHGTNKRIYYRIYKSVAEIDEAAIVKLLTEAVKVDIQGKIE